MSTPISTANAALPARIRRWGFVGVVSAMYVAGLVWIAPSVGMNSVAGFLLYCLIGTAAIACSWAHAAGGTPGRQLASGALGTIVAVIMTFGSVQVLIGFSYLYPPPRPLFRNRFTDHELSLFPLWARPVHHMDAGRTIALVDHFENLIVLIRPADRASAERPQSRFSFDTVRVEYFGPPPASWLVTRQPNRLIVVTFDAEPREFRLTPGAAKKLEKQCYDDPPESLLSATAILVDAQDHAAFVELATRLAHSSMAAP